ncbi:hypothetical protein [Geminocystis sp.]|uniref:hypothetical protein n=1 Tax=Geminocystis sp. TaxID=2664100 RepID=UPI0035945400
MKTKQILLQEIELMSEAELNEILILVEKMKKESNANKSNSTLPIVKVRENLFYVMQENG